MADKKDYTYGYPSPFAPSDVKETKKYGLQYFQRMYREWAGKDSVVLHQKRRRITEQRAYAEGLQSSTKYKDLMNKSGDDSYLNLDWSIVPIIPKFVDVIVGSMTNQDYKITCTAIDPLSTQKRKDDKLDLLVQMMTKDFTTELSSITGIPLSPQEDIPETKEELDLFMELNYKQATEIAMEQGIELAFNINDFKEVSRRIIRDLVVVGTASCKTFLNNDGINIRYVDPEYLVTSYSNRPDYKNIVHAGEVIKITLQELKRMAGDEFTEEDYRQIAEAYLGKNNNPSKLSKASYYVDGMEMYDYDKYLVDVMDAEFKTVNDIHYEKKNTQYGTSTVNKKDKNYKAPKKSKYKREQMKPDFEVWYSGKYIIGTDYIFDYGMKRNMLRPKSNLTRSLSSYHIYTPHMYNMNNKSIVERMMPFADQIQLIHLKMQQLIAKTRPKGMAIELGSIEGVTKGDGNTFTPLEIQDVYEQTGNLYFRVLDDGGAATGSPRPVQELSGGIGGALQELILSYRYNVERLREVTGVNEVREGSAPNKESLVGVQKMALLASNNATRFINDAYVNLMERTAFSSSLALQDLVQFKGAYKGYIDALGETTLKVVDIGKDVTLHEFGIKVQALPDEEEKAMLEQNIQQSLAQKELRLEDAIMIRNIGNIKLANQLLILRRKKYAQEQSEKAQREMMLNSQVQQESAIAASQAQAQIEQMKQEAESNRLQVEFRLKEEFAQAEHARKLEEIKLQGQIKTEHIETASSDIDSDLTRIRKR